MSLSVSLSLYLSLVHFLYQKLQFTTSKTATSHFHAAAAAAGILEVSFTFHI